MTVTPYLAIRGAVAALDFYRQAFDAVERERLTGDDGRIGHAEILIGNSVIMLADEYPEIDALGPLSRGGTTCTFTIDVADVDAAFAKAVSLGATGVREPADQFHGHRQAMIVDPFGHRWTLSCAIVGATAAQYTQAASASGFQLSTQRKHHDPGDLYYFTLPVQDLAKAQRFFGAVLGWQFSSPTDGHIANISAPPGGINTDAANDAATSDRTPQVWFVVHDIQAAVALVRSLGGTASEPVQYDSGWAAECVDDQGTVFNLSVPAAKYTL
jgi:uncharacterized glyoxalase superfamily protein PhnB